MIDLTKKYILRSGEEVQINSAISDAKNYPGQIFGKYRRNNGGWLAIKWDDTGKALCGLTAYDLMEVKEKPSLSPKWLYIDGDLIIRKTHVAFVTRDEKDVIVSGINGETLPQFFDTVEEAKELLRTITKDLQDAI